MGKVNYIKSCRKEQKCRKCGKVIPVGSPYYKGELYRMNPIICCTQCGLKCYEVTTSDYTRNVGRLVEDWREDFSIGESTVEEVAAALQDIIDTCRDSLDNIPEQLQEGSAGTLLQERIDELESVVDELESCDGWNDFLEQAYGELDAEEQEIIDAEQEKRDGADYEEWYDEFCNDTGENGVAERWKEQVEEAVASFVDETLGSLSY